MEKKKKLKNKKISKLDVPIHNIKVSRSITADFLDEVLKDIDNIDKQIEFLRGLKIYSEEKLNEKKKETIKLSKSFLKAVTKKDNIDSINVDNLELLLEDKDLIDSIYRNLIKYEKLLINGKDVHLLKIFYTNQNRQNKKPINKKVFKPAIAPFPHALVDIIEDELNLINKYIQVRNGFREYLINNDLNHNKYYFGYDISLAIMFSRLLKTYKEKKFYLKKIKKGIKVNLKNIMSDIASKDKDERLYKQKIISKKEDIDKIKYELAYLDLKLESIEENKKETNIIINNAEIEKILVLIKREIFIKGFKIFVFPPAPYTPYIKCEKNDEEINNMVSNHFYFVNEENEDKRYTLNTEQIEWIKQTQASFYRFVRICEDLQIFGKMKDPNKTYCGHFFKPDKNGKNVFIKYIRKKKSDYENISKRNFEEKIKDNVIKNVIHTFLEL